MATPKDIDPEMEDNYDEEADSDFDMSGVQSGPSSSSEDEQADTEHTPARPKKKRKIEKPQAKEEVAEWDSGDEATIKEHKKTRRRQRRKGDPVGDGSDNESEGWRARTRAMRENDKAEKKVNKLASIQGSTVDVDELWEQLNKPGAFALLSGKPETVEPGNANEMEPTRSDAAGDSWNKENMPTDEAEMITIKRTYNFAGETHTEEKTVPKSSAEARLWLSQQASKPQKVDDKGRVVQRPLRKVSRFDPNFSNIDAFKGQWCASSAGKNGPTGPKLNVVEKSKMDWAAHVDTEGLKEELDVAAKAKGGYLHRMDFLKDVEQRKEEEARAARLRGQG